MATEKIIEIRPISVVRAQITIEGDGDLVLNKMNAPTIRQLTDARKDRAKKLEKPNEWEIIMTSLHWRDRRPTDFSEEGMKEALLHNAPCISAFGLKKSFGQAVVRNGLDKYSTKFDARGEHRGPSWVGANYFRQMAPGRKTDVPQARRSRSGAVEPIYWVAGYF